MMIHASRKETTTRLGQALQGIYCVIFGSIVYFFISILHNIFYHLHIRQYSNVLEHIHTYCEDGLIVNFTFLDWQLRSMIGILIVRKMIGK